MRVVMLAGLVAGLTSAGLTFAGLASAGLTFAGLTSAGLAQTVAVDPQNTAVSPDMQVLLPHVGGRVRAQALGADKPAGAVSYTHQWPAIYFETAFEGDRLLLKFHDPVNEYRLLIDDLAPIVIAQPGATEITVSDLADGLHHVRLEKVTESIWLLGAFEGFYGDPTARPASAAAKARQIEFIGDSDMTGYGLRSLTTTCTQEEVRLTSDSQAAYPALVARHYAADYQINAISGRGIVRNFDGMVPDHTMFAIYESILPDQTDTATPYVNQDWQPQIIVLGLGNNDFFSPLKPGEPWLNHDALIDTYIVGMVEFLKTLQSVSADATVMIYWPDRGILTKTEAARRDRDGQSQLIKTAQRLGMKPLQFIAMGDLQLEMTACDAHASAKDHRKRMAWLIDRINLLPDLWSGQ